MVIPQFIRSRCFWAFPLLLGIAVLLERCALRPVAEKARTSSPAGIVNAAADQETAPNPFAIQRPPPVELRPDPEVDAGRLPNGMRYALQERIDGTGGVCFRLLVLAGSMHEEENERGLAHFVEHMAFGKSRHAPQGQVMETMERLGLRAGADTNAYTSSDHTVYKLNLPDTEETSLDSAFTFLRDVADGLLFDFVEVEAECKIVLREMEERGGREERRRVLPAIFPGVPAAHRPPIGLRSVIEQTTASQLRAFWQRHYVPERMVLVVAGDLRRTEMKERITRHFASLAARPAPPDPPRGNPLSDEGLTVECVPVAGETTLALRIAVPQPDEKEAEHAGRRERQLAVELGLRMLDNRLGRRANTARLPIAHYRIQDHRLIQGIHWLEILNASVRPENLPELLRHTISEWRTARATGFDELEFAEARQQMKTVYLKRFVSRLDQPCAAAADLLLESVVKREICESPEDELNRARTSLDALSRQECEHITESAWKQSVTRLIVSGAIESGGEARLESLVQEAWTIPATPPPAVPPPRPLPIAPSGTRGRLTEDHRRVDPGYHEARFANGVEVRLKPIAGLGGAVIVKVDAGWGQSALPPDNPGLGPAAELLADYYPLHGWSQKEFRAGLAVSGLDMKFAVRSDRFEWTGYTDRAVLDRQIQLLCACVSQPGWRTLTKNWRPGKPEQTWLEGRNRDPSLSLKWMKFHVTGGDPRFDPAHPGFMESDSTEVARWLGPILDTERIAITISGDFSPPTALEALATSFGSLPTRAAWNAPCDYPSISAASKGIQQIKASQKSQTAAVLVMALPRPGNASEMIQQRLLTALVNLRLRKTMRREMGISYSPSARSGSHPDAGHQWLMIEVRCPAGMSEGTGRLLRDMIRDLQSNGWTADEFRRAAKPLEAAHINSERSPEWWLKALDQPGKPASAGLLDYQNLLKLEAGTRELAKQIKLESALELGIGP